MPKQREQLEQFPDAIRIGKDDAVCFGLGRILRSRKVRGVIPCHGRSLRIRCTKKFTPTKGVLIVTDVNTKRREFGLSMIQGFWIEPRLAKQIKIHVAAVAGELANGDIVAA